MHYFCREQSHKLIPTLPISGLRWTTPLVITITVTLGLTHLSFAAAQNENFRPLVAALHVHSTVSTGALSLDQLAERAESFGLDAVLLSENFVLRYEYGLFPLRGVLRRAVTFPSALDYGIIGVYPMWRQSKVAIPR